MVTTILMVNKIRSETFDPNFETYVDVKYSDQGKGESMK
jgi:hypothetical protein